MEGEQILTIGCDVCEKTTGHIVERVRETIYYKECLVCNYYNYIDLERLKSIMEYRFNGGKNENR